MKNILEKAKPHKEGSRVAYDNRVNKIGRPSEAYIKRKYKEAEENLRSALGNWLAGACWDLNDRQIMSIINREVGKIEGGFSKEC